MIPKVCSVDHWWSARLAEVVREKFFWVVHCCRIGTFEVWSHYAAGNINEALHQAAFTEVEKSHISHIFVWSSGVTKSLIRYICKLPSCPISVCKVGRIFTERFAVRLHVYQREGCREDCQEAGEERSRSRNLGLVSLIRYKSKLLCRNWAWHYRELFRAKWQRNDNIGFTLTPGPYNHNRVRKRDLWNKINRLES